MKRPLASALKYTLCTLALLATLFPLTHLGDKQVKSSPVPENWFEEAFLFI